MFAEGIYCYFVDEDGQKKIYMSEDGESFFAYPETDEEVINNVYF